QINTAALCKSVCKQFICGNRCLNNHAAKRSERTNARAERVARSRGLSEAQPSVAGPLTGKHLKDVKTDAKATKIRILQMPHPVDN
ncbi:MAG: hypothetical protein ACI4BH_04585, partial [Muribaculaceae bacterium]